MSEVKYIQLKNREIRSYARERLLGNMFIPCLVTFFFFGMKQSFSLMMQLGILGKDLFAFFFYIALFVVMNTAWGIFRYGITRFFLIFITKKKTPVGEVFTGVRQSLEVILGASLILTIINLIFQLPYIVYAFFFAQNTMRDLLISLVMLSIGILISYLFECYLSPMYFVICDNPSMRLPFVVITSLSLMNTKNFFKYIRLQISFLPLYILGLISLGIGLLWVVPYAYTSYAYFYEDLCESYLQNNGVSQNIN